MTENFTVIRRNHGHWDIVIQGKGRAFRIRGEPGAYVAMDEREKPYPVTGGFRTVTSCMAFICEQFMHENLQLKGSSPVVLDRMGNEVRKE